MESPLTLVNRKILEIKKKIQLSEGQRKAHHEECDTERKKNAEKLQELKNEIKELRKNLAKKPEKCGDVMLKVKGKNAKNRLYVSKIPTQEAISVLDQQNLELKKKMDLLRHQNKKSREHLRSLAEEYQELLVQHVVSQQKAKLGSPESFHIRSLENQLHRIEMSVAEACHIRRKYRSIRAGLLEDSASYESTLRRLEESLQKQDEEIKRLQDVNLEAVNLRDSTKGSLLKQEEVALSVGKEREHRLQECRRKVEDRGKALLSLESKMFPAASHRTGGTGTPPSPKSHSPRYSQHSKSQSAHQRLYGQSSGTVDEKSAIYGAYHTSTEEEDENARTVASLEASLAKLKEATGETNTGEVLQRFQSQRETQSRLMYLRRVAEDEKAKLTSQREDLQAELHTSQFAQVCSKEQNLEEIEKNKTLIQIEKERKEAAMQNLNVLSDHIGKIKNLLYNYCQSLQIADKEQIPPLSTEPEFVLTIVSLLKQKFEHIIESTKGLPIDRRLSQMMKQENETAFIPFKKFPEDIFGNANVFATERRHGNTTAPEIEIEVEDDGGGHVKGGPSGPDEIPTRAFLKRQAQLIVDAKARRRFFVVRGPVGAATIGPKIRRDK